MSFNISCTNAIPQFVADSNSNSQNQVDQNSNISATNGYESQNGTIYIGSNIESISLRGSCVYNPESKFYVYINDVIQDNTSIQINCDWTNLLSVSLPSSIITDGIHEIYLVQVDIEGNVIYQSPVKNIAIDLTPPIAALSFSQSSDNLLSLISYNSNLVTGSSQIFIGANQSTDSDSGIEKYRIYKFKKSGCDNSDLMTVTDFKTINENLSENLSFHINSYKVEVVDRVGNSTISDCSLNVVLNKNPTASNITIYLMQNSILSDFDLMPFLNDQDGDSLEVVSVTDLNYRNKSILVVPTINSTYKTKISLNYSSSVLISLFAGIDKFEYKIKDSFGFEATAQIKVKVMTPFTWMPVVSNEISNRANWCGAINVTNSGCLGQSNFPSTSSKLRFDETCDSGDCSANLGLTNVYVGDIYIDDYYTSTIQIKSNSNLTVFGDLIQNNGVIEVLNSANLYVNNKLKLNKGEFRATNANYINVKYLEIAGGIFNAPNNSGLGLKITKDFKVSASTPENPVVFNHNNGSIEHLCEISTVGCIIDLPSNLWLNNLKITSGTGPLKLNSDININGYLKFYSPFGTASPIELNSTNIAINRYLNTKSDIYVYGSGATGNVRLRLMDNGTSTRLFQRGNLGGSGSLDSSMSMLSTEVDIKSGTLKFYSDVSDPLTVYKYYFLNGGGDHLSNGINYDSYFSFKSGTITTGASAEVYFDCSNGQNLKCRVETQFGNNLSFNHLRLTSQINNATINFESIQNATQATPSSLRESLVTVNESLLFDLSKSSLVNSISINNVKFNINKDVSLKSEGSHKMVKGSVRLNLIGTGIHNFNKDGANIPPDNGGLMYPRTTINLSYGGGSVIFYGYINFKPQGFNFDQAIASDNIEDITTLSYIYSFRHLHGTIEIWQGNAMDPGCSSANSNFICGSNDSFMNGSLSVLNFNCEDHKICAVKSGSGLNATGFPIPVILDLNSGTNKIIHIDELNIGNKIMILGNPLADNLSSITGTPIVITQGSLQFGIINSTYSYYLNHPISILINNEYPTAYVSLGAKSDTKIELNSISFLYNNLIIENNKSNNYLTNTAVSQSIFDFTKIETTLGSTPLY